MDTLEYLVEVKNFGLISGTNFTAERKSYINGVHLAHDEKVADRPSIIFPGKSIYFTGQIRGETYRTIMTGENCLSCRSQFTTRVHPEAIVHIARKIASIQKRILLWVLGHVNSFDAQTKSFRRSGSRSCLSGTEITWAGWSAGKGMSACSTL